LAGLKTRELAREIGCANGAVYNLVEDMDDLILRVGSRTLARLDAALSGAALTTCVTRNNGGDGIAVDSKGNVYVAENRGRRIQKFKPVRP
jgi:AcrR family transcriptional regulator